MATLARYQLVRRIGLGGMAEVWKATATGPGGFQKTVAIKKVHARLSGDAPLIGMFIEEAKLVADLVHPNIVQVFDFGQGDSGEYYLAMEYVPGENLAELLKRGSGSGVPREIALYIAVEASKALAYAHAKADPTGKPLGIVHRDVSPQNILLTWTGEVKLADFGIARVAGAIPADEAGIVRGKAAYLSPEQAAMAPLDLRTDLYSLGLVLYELLLGHRALPGSNVHELLKQAQEFRVRAGDISALPQELQYVLTTALQHEPARRFRDAAEMEEALTAVLGSATALEARRGLAALLASLFPEERNEEVAPRREETGEHSVAFTSSILPEGTQAIGTPARLDGTASRPRGWPGRPVWAALGVLAIAAASVAALHFAPAREDRTVGATPVPVLSQRASAPTPTLPLPTSTPATPALAHATPVKPARVSVDARPWCEVWIDGKETASETPLSPHSLVPGRHLFRFVNPALGFELERTVELAPGESVSLFVDAGQKTVAVSRL